MPDRFADQPARMSSTMTEPSEQFRAEWFEQLVDVASATTVAAATELTFAAVRRSLGCDRAAVVTFDEGKAEVVAATADFAADRAVAAESRHLLRLPRVVLLPGTEADQVLREVLGTEPGAVLPLNAGDTAWGALVIGRNGEPAGEWPPLEISMLEPLASSLSAVIRREESSRLLEESHRRLEAFAHAAAHDLRSPLRRIRSFSQILRARLDVEEIDRVQVSDFANRISNGAERLDALLGSMLEHTSISAFAGEPHEYSDLHAVAQTICDGITELSHEPAPTFFIADLPEVRLPADAAERVLRNLIDRVVTDSGPDRGATIAITSESFDGGVRVRVSGNGSERRADSADLDVVEQLLTSRGVKLWLEPEVGAGSTFIIEFPAASLRVDTVGLA